jgi:hypothetical protein
MLVMAQLKTLAEVQELSRQLAEKYRGPVITQLTSDGYTEKTAVQHARMLADLHPGTTYYVVQSRLSGALSVADGVAPGYIKLTGYLTLRLRDNWKLCE